MVPVLRVSLSNAKDSQNPVSLGTIRKQLLSGGRGGVTKQQVVYIYIYIHVYTLSILPTYHFIIPTTFYIWAGLALGPAARNPTFVVVLGRLQRLRTMPGSRPPAHFVMGFFVFPDLTDV